MRVTKSISLTLGETFVILGIIIKEEFTSRPKWPIVLVSMKNIRFDENHVKRSSVQRGLTVVRHRIRQRASNNRKYLSTISSLQSVVPIRNVGKGNLEVGFARNTIIVYVERPSDVGCGSLCSGKGESRKKRKDVRNNDGDIVQILI